MSSFRGFDRIAAGLWPGKLSRRLAGRDLERTLMHKILISLAATTLLAGCASDQSCIKLNKTSGTVVGAVGGAVLGGAIFGSTLGTVAGGAAGGLAGHELSHNGRKRCR